MTTKTCRRCQRPAECTKAQHCRWPLVGHPEHHTTQSERSKINALIKALRRAMRSVGWALTQEDINSIRAQGNSAIRAAKE